MIFGHRIPLGPGGRSLYEVEGSAYTVQPYIVLQRWLNGWPPQAMQSLAGWCWYCSSPQVTLTPASSGEGAPKPMVEVILTVLGAVAVA